MQISAVRSMNIKANNTLNFKGGEGIEKAPPTTEDIEQAGKALQDMVDDGDKGFFAKLFTVLGFAATSAGSTGGVAQYLDSLFADGVSGAIETGLRFAHKKVKGLAGNLKNIKNEKFGDFAKKSGEILEIATDATKDIYKKLGNTSNKRFGMAAGIIATLVLVPKLMKKDNNDDGVQDYKQTCQSAYADQQAAIEKMSKKAQGLAKIKSLLT